MSNVHAIAEAEVAHLTAEGKKGADNIAQAIRRNLRTWEELRAEDPVTAKWLLLDACVARADVSHEWSSPIYAERITWARSTAHRLLREHGRAAASRIPQALALIRRLIGGHEADDVRAAQQEKAAA